MKTIYKYKVKITARQIVEMPVDAEILSVQVQNNEINIWASVDSEEETREALIEVFGTGHPMPEDRKMDRVFIGTIQIMGGKEVYHFFELVAKAMLAT